MLALMPTMSLLTQMSGRRLSRRLMPVMSMLTMSGRCWSRRQMPMMSRQMLMKSQS
jgi:hypothetical protein